MAAADSSSTDDDLRASDRFFLIDGYVEDAGNEDGPKP